MRRATCRSKFSEERKTRREDGPARSGVEAGYAAGLWVHDTPALVCSHGQAVAWEGPVLEALD